TNGFATLDLLEVNVFSGESKLLKYGASPTYIKRHGKVQKIISNAFPPGLEECTESINKPVCFRLSEGNVVVMGTDGVLETGDLSEMESLIKGEDDGARLVNGLIDMAAHSENRISDDMTLLVATLVKVR
ncbi:MAG: SpoIIE family protein phosphatase, partial [Clostridia bacterium]|nr:SpoIIE family protein phosphatase [Clostridia bacterium]